LINNRRATAGPSSSLRFTMGYYRVAPSGTYFCANYSF
jgi:hypothetical protein